MADPNHLQLSAYTLSEKIDEVANSLRQQCKIIADQTQTKDLVMLLETSVIDGLAMVKELLLHSILQLHSMQRFPSKAMAAALRRCEDLQKLSENESNIEQKTEKQLTTGIDPGLLTTLQSSSSSVLLALWLTSSLFWLPWSNRNYDQRKIGGLKNQIMLLSSCAEAFKSAVLLFHNITSR
jgi:hypothetical protein